MATACDEIFEADSYMGLFLVFYKISDDYQPEMSPCDMTEVCLEPQMVIISSFNIRRLTREIDTVRR